MALANAKQIADFADRLTQSADSIHERLLKALRNGEVDASTAQLIFQDEALLRQRASSLYIDAANCIVTDLGAPQKSVIELIDAANSKMAKIKAISKFIDLIADLLVLAAAAYAAKPGPILAALKEVKQDVEGLRAKA